MDSEYQYISLELCDFMTYDLQHHILRIFFLSNLNKKKTSSGFNAFPLEVSFFLDRNFPHLDIFAKTSDTGP